MENDTIFYKFYEIYKFLDITYDEFMDIVNELDIVSRENYDGKYSYEKYLNEKIGNRFNKIIKNVFKSNDRAFYIIDKFINNNLKNVDNYDEGILNISKLMSFLRFVNYVPEPDMIIKLFESNNTITGLVDIIVNKYLDFIKSGKINNIFNDQLLVLFVEVYASKKGIEIEENDTIDDTYNPDGICMYLREISNYPLLTDEEVKELVSKIKKGDKEAKKKFVEHNLRLVIKFAKKYFKDNNTVPDIIQDGNIGLMIAAEKYDDSKGFKFSTYARFWIMQCIIKNGSYLNSDIKLPLRAINKIRSYKEAKKRLEDTFHREATIKEIAEELNISLDKAYEILNYQVQLISLNDNPTEESEDSIMDFVPSDDKSTEMVAEEDLLVDEMYELFKKCNLTENEILVLVNRFGMDGNSEKTLEEISNIINLSRERVRQIMSNALCKIRKSSYIKDFAYYIDSPLEGLKRLNEYKRAYKKGYTNRYRSNPLKGRRG